MPELTVKEALQKALDILQEGQNWKKMDYNYFVADCKECAVSAVGLACKTSKSKLFDGVIQALTVNLPGPYVFIDDFNDAPETTFQDVKALFQRAIATQN